MSFSPGAALMILFAVVCEAKAAYVVTAEVLSSNSNTHTVRFTFSGDMSGLTPRGFYDDSLFMDYGSSAALTNSLPTSIDITSFLTNTASRTDGGLIDLIETRESDSYFNRIRFGFTSDFVVSDAFAANSLIDVVFPTTAPLTSSNFAGLPIYWGLGNNSVPSFTVAVPEPSNSMFWMLGATAILINYRRRATISLRHLDRPDMRRF